MKKKILLVEPAYKTKYPPLGLMKLSTYHKNRGDDVTFVKGCDKGVQYKFWDRIYITTLFTWTWKETIKTVKFYHSTIFNFSNRCFVGGILASLMPNELFNETGIQPITGLLYSSKQIHQNDNVVIDGLPPDYDILAQVENTNFQYSNKDAYLGYSTRGCVWKCEFCAVKTFEPKYIPYINIKKMVKQIKEGSGEKQNLLLMDNNVLASPQFDKIIDGIKSVGFVKGARFGPTKRKRIVDFNQGLDARFLTEHKMKRLSEIPLEPMRVAFDEMKHKDVYVKAVRLAHKYGQTNMSNYILYNYKDTLEDFYERLRINIELNEEFKNNGSGVKTTIYSFPMRYIPLKAKNRDIDTGNSHWNKRYLRAVKVILNVTKGPVMPGASFFYQAFGRNPEEFKAILSMPDDFIRNRLVQNWKKRTDYRKQWMPYVRSWMETYFEMSYKERERLTDILAVNDLHKIDYEHKNSTTKKIKKLLKCHLKSEDIVHDYKYAK